MIERLEQIRKILKLSKKDFSEVLGFTQQAYNNYSKGKRDLQVHHLYKLQELYNISSDWLLTGKGHMTITNNNKTIIKETIIKNLEILDENQLQLIYHFTEAERTKKDLK